MAWRLAASLLLISLSSLASPQEATLQRVQVPAPRMADLIVKEVAPVYPAMARRFSPGKECRTPARDASLRLKSGSGEHDACRNGAVETQTAPECHRTS